MSELATLARPYAQAVFDLAIEAERLSAWSDWLSFLSVVITTPEMSELASNPRFSKAKLVDLLLELAQSQDDLELDKSMQNLLKVMADNQRLAVLAEVSTQFEVLKAEKEGSIKVKVISTFAVKANQKKELTQALEKRFGKSVDIEVEIDRKLMGGWLIRANDQVIDLTVRGRMQQLSAELLA